MNSHQSNGKLDFWKYFPKKGIIQQAMKDIQDADLSTHNGC